MWQIKTTAALKYLARKSSQSDSYYFERRTLFFFPPTFWQHKHK